MDEAPVTRTRLFMLVISKFRSVSAFGKKLRWTRQKANRIVRGRSEPTLQEAKAILKVLDMDNPQDAYNLFFGENDE